MASYPHIPIAVASAIPGWPGTGAAALAEGILRGSAGRVIDRVIHATGTATMTDTLDMEDVRLSRQGDGEAYRRLVERHQDRVSGIVWRFSRDRTVHEQLVQDVFVEAYLSLAGFRGSAPFGHWLARIATRVGYHYWKGQARQSQAEALSLGQWDMIQSDGPDVVESKDAADLLHRLLALLPPRDRLVLTLRYIEDLDVAETALRTGWSKTMVKVQTLRARKKLEKLLAPYEQESIL